MTGRPAPQSTGRRPAKLSRDAIVNAALTFLDRDGWDALTINALATQLGTKGPSLYNHVNSLEDLRRTVRMRVVGDIIEETRTPGGAAWNPLGWRSSSPSMLFSWMPVPGTRSPEPSPFDVVIAAMLPSSSATLT